jgi:ATP-dependent RNA helicase DDX31/DBP7
MSDDDGPSINVISSFQSHRMVQPKHSAVARAPTALRNLSGKDAARGAKLQAPSQSNDSSSLKRPAKRPADDTEAVPARFRVRPKHEFKPAVPSALPEAPKRLTIPHPSANATSHSLGALAGARVDTFVELGLRDNLCDWLATRFGISSPTAAQVQTIPLLLRGRDVILQAPTGSGKTLCYLLPIVHSLLQQPSIDRTSGTHAIIVAPTRELVAQISEVGSTLTRNFHAIVCGSIMGGEKRKSEKARLRKGVHVVVGSPGRLLDHISHTESWLLNQCFCVGLDEADRLLDMGFERDVFAILEAVQQRSTIPNRIGMLASATVGSRVIQLSKAFLRNPQRVSVCEASSAAAADGDGDGIWNIPSKLRQHFCVVPPKMRLAVLATFLRGRTSSSGSSQKILVFVASKACAEFLVYALGRMTMPEPKARRSEDWTNKSLGNSSSEDEDAGGSGARLHQRSKNFKGKAAAPSAASETTEALQPLLAVPILILHGDMGQADRMKCFYSFNHSRGGILVTTDVAARGLDFPDVGWIVQYDAPGDTSDYVHRVGRTARIDHDGDALLFLHAHELQYTQLLSDRGVVLNALSLQAITSAFTCVRSKGSDDVDIRVRLLQFQVEDMVSSDETAKKLASSAFASVVRAYATHSKDCRHIFSVHKLHQGHLAASFGLTETPNVLAAQGQRHSHSNKGRENGSSFRSSDGGDTNRKESRPQRRSLESAVAAAKDKARGLLRAQLLPGSF